jgi:hypothetical protein
VAVTDEEKIAAYDALVELVQSEDKVVIVREGFWDNATEKWKYRGTFRVGMPYDSCCVWDVTADTIPDAIRLGKQYVTDRLAKNT